MLVLSDRHLTWRTSMKKIAILFLFVLVSTINAASVWLPTQTLDSSKDWLANPVVGVDGIGNAIVIWINSGTNEACVSRFNNSSQTWGSVSRLSMSTSEKKRANPSIEMDEAGNALAIWEGDYIEAAYYDIKSNQWSLPKKLSKSLEHRVPGVGFFPNGNGMALWYESETKTVQASSFDSSKNEWTSPVRIAEKVTLSNINYFTFKTDKSGNGCAVWVEGDSESPVIKAAYYFKDALVWSQPFEVAKPSTSSGFDLYFKSNENLVVVWSEGPLSRIHAMEFHSKTLNKIDSKIVAFGCLPKVAVNASNAIGISSVFSDVEFRANANILKEDEGVYSGKKLIMAGFVFFHSLGIDDRGNVLAAWCEMGDNSSMEKVSVYSANTNAWSTPKELSRGDKEKSLGMTAVAMHPKGHAVIAWDRVDSKTGNCELNAVIYRPE